MAAETKQEGQKAMQEHMELYQKLATPGAPHKLLARMAGSWHTQSKFWTVPGMPPVTSEGSCEQTMILDGRFLQQDYTGDMMGAPFSGVGVTGYDNNTQQYVGTWMDSMSTGIFFFAGTADDQGKTIIQYCRYNDPIKGPVRWRSVTKIVDDNTHRFEMYVTDKSDQEEKMMEITYTRKK
jgi:hypothetical protein